MTEQSTDKTYGNKASTTMTVARWHEAAYVDIDGEGTKMGDDVYIPHRGLTTAETDYTYAGDIQGTGVALAVVAVALITLGPAAEEGRAPAASPQTPPSSLP